ncbi:MAG: PIN domain-containing protein [candidate division NC10 bacterium]
MPALVDTNVLVYRFDPRFPRKQEVATELLRRGLVEDQVRIPHQAVVEFVAAVTRPLAGGRSLLTPDEARREAEELLRQFVILYPTETLLRTAIRGWGAYQLGWFDAHLWAYAEEYGLGELVSEDFQHDRLYGAVRVVNPFL